MLTNEFGKSVLMKWFAEKSAVVVDAVGARLCWWGMVDQRLHGG